MNTQTTETAVIETEIAQTTEATLELRTDVKAGWLSRFIGEPAANVVNSGIQTINPFNYF